MNLRHFLAVLFAVALPGTATRGAVAPVEFTNWPAGTSPLETGRRVAENFLPRPFTWQTDAKAYAPAARKAWLALVGCLDADANVREVCIGTNKGRMVTGSDDLKVQSDFYLARPREAGDFHGQAPILWSAAALLR